MRYIKTYEDKYRSGRNDGYKPAFKSDIGKKISEINESFQSFDFGKIYQECAEHSVDFKKILFETLLNKKIAFQSDYWCNLSFDAIENWKKSLSELYTFIKYKSIGVIDYCENIKILSYQEILIKLRYEEICVWLPVNRKIRVYNYTEGYYMQELESKKAAQQYNL